MPGKAWKGENTTSVSSAIPRGCLSGVESSQQSQLRSTGKEVNSEKRHIAGAQNETNPDFRAWDTHTHRPELPDLLSCSLTPPGSASFLLFPPTRMLINSSEFQLHISLIKTALIFPCCKCETLNSKRGFWVVESRPGIG